MPFRQELYELARASGVSAILKTKDNIIAVQRRSNRVFAAGKLDSSASGMCSVTGTELNFRESILEKINIELNLPLRDIVNLSLTGVHRSMNYASIQVTYKFETSKTFKEIARRANGDYITELIGVPEKNLPQFILDTYISSELIGDGCASLLSYLNANDLNVTVKELIKRGKIIRFGELVEGKFIEK